jgi:BTB/POZ domain
MVLRSASSGQQTKNPTVHCILSIFNGKFNNHICIEVISIQTENSSWQFPMPTDSESSRALSSRISKLQSSALNERTSSVYPAGHGDLALITVDNVVFHVHRAVLQHSSLVFGTIFDNGPKGEQDDDPQPPLKMETDALTLEALLTFTYPDRPSPSIGDVKALASLFRAAKRYEMEGVLHQLRRSLVEIKIIRDSLVQPLYIKSPLAVLIICYAFDCFDEGRLALRECLKGNLEDHITGAQDFDLPSELLSTLLRLRSDRMSWLKTKLDALPWPTNGCQHCLQRFGEWKLETTLQVQSHLAFEQLKAGVSKAGNCRGGHAVLQPDPRNALADWLVEAQELEGSLPKLPRIP